MKIPEKSSIMRKGSKDFNSLLKSNAKKQNKNESKEKKQPRKPNAKKKLKKPSNASSDNSTITLMLMLGKNLLSHQSWFRHDVSDNNSVSVRCN